MNIIITRDHTRDGMLTVWREQDYPHSCLFVMQYNSASKGNKGWGVPPSEGGWHFWPYDDLSGLFRPGKKRDFPLKDFENIVRSTAFLKYDAPFDSEVVVVKGANYIGQK